MLSMLSRLTVALVTVLAFGIDLVAGAPVAQIDPAVRDRVVSAAVAVAILVRRHRERGDAIGISPDGQRDQRVSGRADTHQLARRRHGCPP